MIVTHDKALARLKRYLSEYRPQIERAQAAIQALETTAADSDEFSQALADLSVCATILAPYSEGLTDAIDQYTEDIAD